MNDFWKSPKKIGIALLVLFLLVCGIGGAGMLFHCDIPCSDIFGVGILFWMSLSVFQNTDALAKELNKEGQK